MVDEAVATVARSAAIARDHCPGAPTSGAAGVRAAMALDEVTGLARAVAQIGAVFAAADTSAAPGTVSRPDDLTLASALATLAPGLSTGELSAPLDNDRGLAIGRQLDEATPKEAKAILDDLGSALDDPEIAAGILAGLSAEGLTRLVHQADVERSGLAFDLADHQALLAHLNHLLNRAATTVSGQVSPLGPVGVSTGGLDLALIARLGRTPLGREALRAVVAPGSPTRIPTPVTVALAEALLLGPTSMDDLMATGFTPGPGGVGDRGDRGDRSERQIIDLLAADPVAAYALELAHPRGPSPTLTILARAHRQTDLAAAASVLDHVLNTAVERGWAQPWQSPRTGEVARLEATPVHRVLTGLTDVIISRDSSQAIPPELSRVLAKVVDRHLDFFAEDLEIHPTRNRDSGVDLTGPLTGTARFFEAIARDLPALRSVADTVTRPDEAAITRTLAAYPPGRLNARDIEDALDRERPLVHELRRGADAAGRHDNRLVLAPIRLAADLLPAALSVAGRAVGAATGGPIGGVAGGVAGRQAGNAATEPVRRGIESHVGHRNDDRELVAVHPTPYRAIEAAVAAMVADDAWRRELRFGIEVPDIDVLRGLDLDGSPADRTRFDTWLAIQDPVVAEVFTATLDHD